MRTATLTVYLSQAGQGDEGGQRGGIRKRKGKRVCEIFFDFKIANGVK